MLFTSCFSVTNMLRNLCLFLGLLSRINGHRYVKTLTKHDFEMLREKPGIQVVYFYGLDKGEDKLDDTEEHTLRHFHKEFERSASVLNLYQVDLCLVDCRNDKVEEYCNMEKVYLQVFIFRQGIELLNLSVESMFDVNSIVSNVLQVALLREMPILQSKTERLQYENQAKGHSDVIYSYQMAIGTFEHRVLTEVAYVYREMFQFAISTDKTVSEGLPDVGEKEEWGIWLLQCNNQTSKSKKPCPAAKYHGPISLAGVGNFMRDLNLSPLQVLKNDETSDPYESSSLHSVYVFHDTESHKLVHKEATHLSVMYRGSIGVVMVNVEKVYAPDLGFPEDGKIPNLAIKDKKTGRLIFMEPEEEPEYFVAFYLSEHSTDAHKDSSKSHTVEPYSSYNKPDDSLADVEKQDDDVAMAVSRLRGREVKRDYVPALTDKTFPTEIRDRELLIVLFYLPFDAMSSAYLYTIIQASEDLAAMTPDYQSPLAAVNCYDWTDVCSKNNVTLWPTIRVYKLGKLIKEHRGMMSVEHVISAVRLYLGPAPVKITSEDDLNSFLAGNIPNSKLQVDVVALGLVNDHDDNSLNMLAEISDILHGEMAVGIATGKIAEQMIKKSEVSLPCLIVVKTEDPYQPQTVTPLTGKDVSQAVSWIKQSALPVLTELTPSTLPSVFAKNKPIIIYFTPAPSSDSDTFTAMATRQLLGNLASKMSDTVFTWMDVSDQTTKQILEAYTGDSKPETLVLLNRDKGHVHVYPAEPEEEAVKTWILDTVKEPSYVLPPGDWKPRNPGYDFLSMMDREAEQKQERMRAGDQGMGYYEEEEIGEGLRESIDEFEFNLPQATDASEMNERAKLHSSRLYRAHPEPSTMDRHEHVEL